MRRYYQVNTINYYKNNSPIKQLNYDIAVSNQGKCILCRKEIPKGTPILWYWGKFKKYKKASIPNPTPTKTTATELNIKKKVCFRCIDKEIFKDVLSKHQEEVKKIHQLKKRFKRALKGKKCKRAIENSLVLEELQKEDFTKNFDSKLFHR
jgi:ribosomal protein L34E